MAEGDESKVYAFNTKADFDRAARAIRYAESRMRGEPAVKNGPDWLRSPTVVHVNVTAGVDADGYYPSEFTYYDDEQEDWVTLDDDGDCLAFGINDETLEADTRYKGVIAGYKNDKPIVAVTVGGPTTAENSFDMVTEWELDDSTTPCTIVPSLVRTITGRFTVGAEHAP